MSTPEHARNELALAWQAFAREPDDAEPKRTIVGLLKRQPGLLEPHHREPFSWLLRDAAVEPIALSRAGWALVVQEGWLELEEAALATRIEHDPLALALLEESYVISLEAERALTALRRWLLLNARWEAFPRTAGALVAQAAHNGGAWLVDAGEQERIGSTGSDFAAAYVPHRPTAGGEAAYDDQVTDLVADQYRGWPFPVWTRITAPAPTTIPAALAAIDPGGSLGLPEQSDLLIAGCGTGRECAILAARYPDARITAIDISETSLAYAKARVGGVGFHRLDIHRVDELRRSFDVIVTSGVLHHLPAPEAGWQALVSVLKPGGVMKVMLYSRVGRLQVQAARTRIADLLDRPVDDTLLREARRRLIERTPGLLAGWNDFYTLPGLHDLLLNRHEDAFDVPRIGHAIAALGLDLLGFVLPGEERRGRYRDDNPHDPLFRDLTALGALEKTEPFLFSGMYEFWCRKPG